MTEYICQHRYESTNGQSAVTIEQGDHGLYRFTVWRWAPAEDDGSEFDHAYWIPSLCSGLYSTLGEVIKAAEAEVGWLQL